MLRLLPDTHLMSVRPEVKEWPVRDPQTTARRRRVWTLLPAATIAAAAVAVFVATAVSTPDKPHDGNLPALTALRPAAKLLTPFASCDSLLDGLRTHGAAHLNSFGWTNLTGNRYDSGPLVAAASNAGASERDQKSASLGASGQTSTTNVQEVGVDEPDVVKTAADHVLTVTDGRLRVIDASSRTQTASLDLRTYANWQGAQLLASAGKAVVLLTSAGIGGIMSPGGGVIAGPAGESIGPHVAASSPSSTLLYVDLVGTPRVTGSIRLDGSILDARMVNSTVRVVSSTSPRITPPLGPATESDYRAALRTEIRNAPLQAWLPSYTITGPSGTRNATVPCASVSHPVDYTAASMLTVYTVDPNMPNADPKPVSLSADGDTVYATTTSLYVASSPMCVWCYRDSTTTSSTEIHRFDITGSAKPTYLGSGSVKGSLLSQYSLSDYKGSLRVATTVMNAKGATVSGVDVLDAQTLKQTGAVTGLGAGERVYSVRFLGPRGYVVTYQQQDPLYVLDLADPRAPRLRGSLEIPGFSSYLHDVGDGRLLGVGQDTSLVSEGGGQYAHNEGRMVQLFDVRNAAKPARTARVVLPGTGTPGDPSFDPHAFLYWAPTGLVVVPVANYGDGVQGGVLGVRVEGSTLVKVGTVQNRAGSSGVDGGAIQRSMIVNGALWTFSPSGVRVSDQATLAERAWIPFA